jgi:hypothetical protein
MLPQAVPSARRRWRRASSAAPTTRCAPPPPATRRQSQETSRRQSQAAPASQTVSAEPWPCPACPLLGAGAQDALLYGSPHERAGSLERKGPLSDDIDEVSVERDERPPPRRLSWVRDLPSWALMGHPALDRLPVVRESNRPLRPRAVRQAQFRVTHAAEVPDFTRANRRGQGSVSRPACVFSSTEPSRTHPRTTRMRRGRSTGSSWRGASGAGPARPPRASEHPELRGRAARTQSPHLRVVLCTSSSSPSKIV